MSYKPKISLVMIVKNESDNLERCLQSVADLVDEIIIVDTGSTDTTKKIAKKFDASIFDYEWHDHFADARNESIGHANGDWIFWLDGDEYFNEENREKLKKLFANLKDENVVYLTNQVNTLRDAPGQEIIFTRPSLFRNRSDIRWKYRVHEQILPLIQESGGEMVETDIRLQHSGYHDPEQHKRKIERNLRLLHMDLNENPDDPFIIFHLGLMYQSVNRYAEAINYWPIAINRLVATHSMAVQSFYLWAEALLQLGQQQKAVEVCREGINRFPDDPELIMLQARFFAMAGKAEEAEKCLYHLLEGPKNTGNRMKSSYNTGIYSFQPHCILAQIYTAKKQPAKAEEHYKKALESNPFYRIALEGLAELYRQAGREEEYQDLCRRIESLNP